MCEALENQPFNIDVCGTIKSTTGTNR